MSVDTKVVEKLAELSRLEFSASGQAAIARELEAIFGFISKLQEAETEGITPMTSVLEVFGTGGASTTPERPDEISEEVGEAQREAFQKNAPKADMGFYVVPRVVE
jgi:aspartyl-tRNA(Asn)/glutamyl-tRNA(Gln) amidotransferase subunit C